MKSHGWMTVMLVVAATSAGCVADVDDAYDEATDSWDDETFGEASAFAQAGEPTVTHPITFARDNSEAATGLRIRDDKHTHPKVIYSVATPGLSPTEQVRLRAEVAVSRCNKKDIAGQSGDADITPCTKTKMVQSPYGYNPRVSAAIFLGDGPYDTKGPRVSPWFDMTCTEGKHHCAISIPEIKRDGLPNAPDKFFNLVVTADARGDNAKEWHVMEVEQHKGGLFVTRLGPGWKVAHHDKTTKLLSNGKMPADQPAEDGDPTQVARLVHQLELNNLKPGDVVSVDARMRAVLDYGGDCDPMINGTVLLTASPTAKDAKKKGDKVVALKNGRNCTDHGSDGCKYDKSGAIRIGNDMPSTMYLSYRAMAVRSCIQPGNKWHIDGGDGFLEATVRR